MKLYIGGAYQGQAELARQENPNARLIVDFHRLMKDFAGDPLAFAEDFFEKNADAVVVCDEIGCGVVPLSPEDRAWRENVGRAMCLLAQKSEQVTRVCCGLGVKIK